MDWYSRGEVLKSFPTGFFHDPKSHPKCFFSLREKAMWNCYFSPRGGILIRKTVLTGKKLNKSKNSQKPFCVSSVIYMASEELLFEIKVAVSQEKKNPFSLVLLNKQQ